MTPEIRGCRRRACVVVRMLSVPRGSELAAESVLKTWADGSDALALTLLQGKLWRQSGFCPPDKHCMQIKERKASFVDWKESAQLEFQKTQLLKTSDSAASGVREDPMMSPRDMTEAQAERMLKVLQKNVLKLAKESNECKDHRRRAEKNLASLKAESVTAAGLRMQGLKEEGARLAAAKEQDLQVLADVDASIKEREKERRGMETLHQRLTSLVSLDDKTLTAMQDELKYARLPACVCAVLSARCSGACPAASACAGLSAPRCAVVRPRCRVCYIVHG